MEPTNGWVSPHTSYSVDIQSSPPTGQQTYSVDIRRSSPMRQTSQTKQDLSGLPHNQLQHYGSKQMQEFYSLSSQHHKHIRHGTSPELHNFHMPPQGHHYTHSSHRHSTEDYNSHALPRSHIDTPHPHGTKSHNRQHGRLHTVDNRPHTARDAKIADSSLNHPSTSQFTYGTSRSPDPYEIRRRSGEFEYDDRFTASQSSQVSYDDKGIPPFDDKRAQRRLSPWELGSTQSSQSEKSEMSFHETKIMSPRSSSGSGHKIMPQPTAKGAVTPNPILLNRGEAWELEEDLQRPSTSGHPRTNAQGTTIGHIDQALLPQKLYFHTSPSHLSRPSHPPYVSPGHHHSQTYTSGQLLIADPDHPHPLRKRHSITGLPTSPSYDGLQLPTHRHDNRSLSYHGSQDFSPKISSTIASTSIQQKGSVASIDSSHSSGSHHSTTSSTMRPSISMQIKPDPSPNISTQGGNRRAAVIDQKVISPEHALGHVTNSRWPTKRMSDHMTSPKRELDHHTAGYRRHSTSDTSGRQRRRHRYDHVRAPHPYENMRETSPLTLYPVSPSPASPSSHSSHKEPISTSPSKGQNHNLKRRENRPKSSPAPKRQVHPSDPRLNRLSKKGKETAKSPAPGKRLSASSVLDEHRTRDKDLVTGKLKQRVSSSELQPYSQMEHQHFSTEDNVRTKEQSLSDSDGTSAPPIPIHKRGSKSKIMHKIVKTFSKMSIKGTASGEGGEASDGSGGGGRSSWSSKRAAKKKKRTRSNSVSNLTDPDESGRLTQSMEQLADISRTPGGTPSGTPKMIRSPSKNRLARRGSEPDLEGAPMTNLFRSGSKKNLATDPNEVLFELIEQGNTEGVQQLLYSSTSHELNLQLTNDDDLLPLDVATMLNHEEIAKLLLEKGAKDSTKFCRDIFLRFSRIESLLSESERELDSLKHELVTQNVSNSSGLKDLQQRLRKWEWRSHLLKRMKQNFSRAAMPGAPADVTLHVTSGRSLTVTFTEPVETNGAVVTRYKIEWCKNETFSPVVGEFVMTDLRSMEYVIPDLDKGENYFVRVSAYNMKGFGPACDANPSSAVPSNWHDEDNSHPRYEGKTDQMYALSAELNMMLSQSPPLSPPPGSATPGMNRTRGSLIHRLFGSGIKFHKSLKSGVYIASLVYAEDKILVTMDEHIPIVEISDSDPNKFGPDFVWLAKVACTWENVRVMCESSDKYTSSPAVQFRNKLLHAVLALQEALGMQDLGLLHPVPYKDKHSAYVFILVRCLKEAKLKTSSFKWMSLPRLRKRRAPASPIDLDTLPVPDQLVLEAHEITDYHTNSTRKLGKGLYLGYLKGRSTVASIKVICSREYPNVLPYMKIRDNPNISRDEWQWFQSLSSPNPQPFQVPAGPQSLQETLLHKIETFLHNLKIPKEDISHHRLYKFEAIELNEDITFLLLLPPPEHVCTAPGSTDHFDQLSNFVALPINTFEIMQLYTYQPNFMIRYSMVSARLDLELLTATQKMREAFSNEELRGAKKINEDLEKFQERAEPAWKQMRWIEEAVQRGRDSSNSSESLLSVAAIRSGINRIKQREAQIQHVVERKRERESTQQSRQSSLSSGYLRVFPAYATGLVKGTSVKLFITLYTTTAEVIQLVVHQLEKARLERGVSGKMLTEDDLSDFYLVGMTDTREWILDCKAYPLTYQASTHRLEVRRHSEQFRYDDYVTSV